MFRQRVMAVVRCIPAGKTLTYGEVARQAGHPRAARAVGVTLRTNFDPTIPCHRVVGTRSIGSYNRGGSVAKRRLLRGEGAVL